MQSIHESSGSTSSYNEEFLEFKKGFFSQRSNSVRRHNTITHTNNNSESNSNKSASRVNSRRCSDSSYSSWVHDPISTTEIEPESLKLDTLNSSSDEALLLTTPPPPITTNPFTKLARKLKKSSTSSASSNQTTRTSTGSIFTDPISKPNSISTTTTSTNTTTTTAFPLKYPFPESTSSSSGLHLNIPLKVRSLSMTSSPIQLHTPTLGSPNTPLSTTSGPRRKTVPSLNMPAVSPPVIDISDDYFMKFGMSNNIVDEDEESLYSIEVDYESDVYAVSSKTEYATSGWYLKDGLLIEDGNHAGNDSQLPVRRNEEEVVADLVATDVLERLNY